MSQSEVDNEYLETLQRIKNQKEYMLGKPVNLAFDFSRFSSALSLLMNNTGDPFHSSSHKLDTKQYERRLLGFFAQAYDLPMEDMFGYVTSGGTESLEYGLLQGMRKNKQGVVFFSEDTHYSAQTIVNKYLYTYEIIPSLPNGEMNYDILAKSIAKVDYPIIIANIGTTMKGALDDLDKILSLVDSKQDFYIHCDAALHGAFLPFITEHSFLSFSKPIDSLSISLHKFLGNVTPAGLVLARNNEVQANTEGMVEYISSPNTTLSCSRSGLASFLAAYQVDSLGREGISRIAKECISLAQYLYHQLKELGIEALINDYSNIVYFKAPDNIICEKWMMPLADTFTHVVVMPHVTKRQIDELLSDMLLKKTPKIGACSA